MTSLEAACCAAISASLLSNRDSKYVVALKTFRSRISGGSRLPFRPLLEILATLAKQFADECHRRYEIPASDLGFWLEVLQLSCEMLGEGGSVRALGLRAVGVDRLNARCLGRLPLLRCVVLEGGCVTDALLSSLSSLRLSSVVLSGGRVTEPGLAALGRCTSLTLLSLRNAREASDSVASSLGRLTALTYLDLSNTRVTDRGFKHLAGGAKGRADDGGLPHRTAGRGDQAASPSGRPRGGLRALKFFRAHGSSVTGDGVRDHAPAIPSLCCVEWGASAEGPRLWTRDGGGSDGAVDIPAVRDLMREALGSSAAWISVGGLAGTAGQRASVKRCGGGRPAHLPGSSSPPEPLAEVAASPSAHQDDDPLMACFSQLCGNLIHRKVQDGAARHPSPQCRAVHARLLSGCGGGPGDIGPVSFGATPHRQPVGGTPRDSKRFGTTGFVMFSRGLVAGTKPRAAGPPPAQPDSGAWKRAKLRK